MLKSDRILALDIGASKIVLAEFSVKSSRVPQLLKYGIQELGSFGTESDASSYIVSAVHDLMREHHIKRAPLLMTLSGQQVFPRYVKLPPVKEDKIEQIIRYEAEQNVPFPIDEVVWDYQLIGDASEGEQNVMLVAVKSDSVQELTDCVLAADLEPEIVDVAPMALYNAVRYNYPDLEGCTMILDIGARSSNLVFIEDDKIFSRSIPVAGNTITQELVKDFQVSFDEAEKLKREHAFVALGGVSAADNETADRVSRIVRNVVTRLHAEANRSINFYRGQQSGSPPKRILLTGGSSVIPYMDTFFREKLKVDVEYLNPFINVAVSGHIDTEAASEKLFLLGEVVGLALRRALTCPVEVNLMPKDLVEKKRFRSRIPYFGVAVGALALALVAWGLDLRFEGNMLRKQEKRLTGEIKALTGKHETIRGLIADRKEVEAETERLASLIRSRTIWSEVLETLEEALLDGMWIRHIAALERNEEGMVTRIKIDAAGFKDRLDRVETADVDQTAITIFKDQLASTDVFSDDIQIISQILTDDRLLREFTLEVELAYSQQNSEVERVDDE